MSAPAGWYDDGSGRSRWWDGTRWTEHYAPEATVTQAPTPEPAFTQAPTPTVDPTPVLGYIGLGLAAVGTVLACIPAVFFVGVIVLIAAFVVSLIGVFKKAAAKWPAVAGIVLSIVGGVIGTVIFVIALATNLTAADDGPTQTEPSASTEQERPSAEELTALFAKQLQAAGTTNDDPDFSACVAQELYDSDLTDAELQLLMTIEDPETFQGFADGSIACAPIQSTSVDGDIHGAGKEFSIGSGMTMQIQVRADQLREAEPILPGKPVTEEDYEYSWGDAVETDGQIAVVTVTVRNNGDALSDNGAYLNAISPSGGTFSAGVGMFGALDYPSDFFNIDGIAPGEAKIFTEVYAVTASEIDQVTFDLLLISDMGEGTSFLIQ